MSSCWDFKKCSIWFCFDVESLDCPMMFRKPTRMDFVVLEAIFVSVFPLFTRGGIFVVLSDFSGVLSFLVFFGFCSSVSSGFSGVFSSFLAFFGFCSSGTS